MVTAIQGKHLIFAIHFYSPLKCQALSEAHAFRETTTYPGFLEKAKKCSGKWSCQLIISYRNLMIHVTHIK